MKPMNPPPQSVLNILQNCCERYEPCTVYIFGYQITQEQDKIMHYVYLLVFTKMMHPHSASVMADNIYELSERTLLATILVHKPTDLSTTNVSQLGFFDSVLRFGHRLCLDKSAIPYVLHNHLATKDREGDKKFWLKCIAVAQFNIHAATEHPHLEVELCKIALLNTACVQIALGLIRVNMGYTPNEFGLKCLLQLCGHFTNLPTEIFGRHTPKDKNRYKMLCAPPSMLNHWTKLNANEEDFLFLLDATQQFLSLATELVERKLNFANVL